MIFEKNTYYLLFALAFGAAALILIPKQLYKKFFIYGLLFGGAFNIITILTLSGIFHLFQYFQIGPAGIWGLFSFFTPVTWVFVVMLYLYFLPVRKIFLYPYILGFIVFAYMFGLPLEGLGLFKFYHNYQYFQPLTFIIWFSLAAWAYIKGEKVVLK